MVGRGPFEGMSDDDIDPTYGFGDIDTDDEGESARAEIYEDEDEDLARGLGLRIRPDNPAEGSLVSWNISNSPVESLFNSLNENFSGDPTKVIRAASRGFTEKFNELDERLQYQAVDRFVQMQTDRLRSVISSFDEMAKSPFRNSTQPTGFLSRPGNQTYYNLLANEQTQGMGLRMTYYQVQQRDVMQALLNRSGSVEVIAQGYEHKKALDAAQLHNQRVGMQIALGNRVAQSLFQGANSGARKSYDLVNLDGASFHPKMAYISEDVNPEDFTSARVSVPKVAVFGTQNLTGALTSRSNSEEVLVLNREVSAYAPLMKEIRAATDALLETQRLAHKKQLAGTSFRDKAQQIYSELTGKRQLYANRRFVEMNQDVQLRMQNVLQEAAGSGKRVVMSVQYLENLFRESPSDASVYGDFQRQMRGTLETLASGGRLRVAMQAGRLGNRAGFYEAMDDLLDNKLGGEGSKLLKTLLKNNAIDFAPTNFMHSKSFAVFNADSSLSAFGMMSSNVSRHAAEKNLETGLFIDSVLGQEAKDILQELDREKGITNYYLSTMTGGFNESYRRSLGFASELKGDSSYTQSAYEMLSDMQSKASALSVSRRYRLPKAGENLTDPRTLLSGLDIEIGSSEGRELGFSVSIGREENSRGAVPVVYLNESGRAIVGGVYTNRSRYTIQYGNTILKPGQSKRLDALEMLGGLVSTLDRGIEFESRIRAVNRAYRDSFGDDKPTAEYALNRVLARTFSKAASIVTGDSFDIGEGRVETYDILRAVDRRYGKSVYQQTVAQSKQMLQSFADVYGEGLDPQLKVRLARERTQGLSALFDTLGDDLASRSAVNAAVSRLESTISKTKFGGQAFADVRRRVVEEYDVSAERYKQYRSRAGRELMQALSANFFAPHELGYSASQGLANLPTFAVTDDIVHSLEPTALRQEVISIRGPILNPDLLQHGMSLGRKGHYVRGIASTGRARNYDIYESLGGIVKAEGGTARVYDTEMLFRTMPALGVIRRGEYLKDLENLPMSEELQSRFRQLEEELFTINQVTAEGLYQPTVQESLLLLPYSKTEQISQRLKNLSSTRPALDISDETLRRIRNLGVGTNGSKDLLIDGSVLSGTVKSSLPENQYGVLKNYIDSLDKDLTPEQKEQLVLQKFRAEAIDPTALSKGIIGATTPRRVLHNLGITTMSDFGYINAGYQQSYGYGHRVSVKFKPQALGKGADPGAVISRIERSLGAGVIASVKSVPLGTEAVSALQQEYELLKQSFSTEGVSPIQAESNALSELREKMKYLSISASEGAIRQASLRPGMYKLGSGGISALENLELVGRFDEGSVSFSLLGVETYESGKRSPIKVRLPAFSKREYDGITAFTGSVSSTTESGRVVLQADTVNIMEFRSGLRPGEAAAKGPLTAIDREFFDRYEQMLAGQSGLLPERVRSEPIFAMLPRSAVKGFNYESGLSLLEDADPGVLKLIRSERGGEVVAQSLAVLLLGNKEVRSSLATSLESKDLAMGAAVRLMSKAPKQLRDIDPYLLGSRGTLEGGSSTKRLAAVAGGLYYLADSREGESLQQSLERTVSQALEQRDGRYTERALSRQALLQERSRSLLETARSDDYSMQIGQRRVFQEKGPVVKAASLLAYLASTSQQLFNPASGEPLNKSLIELNLNPYYRESRQATQYQRAEEIIDRKLGQGMLLGDLRDQLTADKSLAAKAFKQAETVVNEIKGLDQRGLSDYISTRRPDQIDALLSAKERFGVDVGILTGEISPDQVESARVEMRKLRTLSQEMEEMSKVAAATKESTLERFLGDEGFRDRVRAMSLGLGVQLPGEDALSNFRRLSQERQQELKKELEYKLMFMYSTFQSNRPVEVLMELSPSRSLVATGMKDMVSLEYQYTTAMTEQALSQYVIDQRTKNTVTDLQSAVMILTEAMNPSARRTSRTELKESALNFRVLNLASAESQYGMYGRALAEVSKLTESFSPILAEPLLRLGKSTSVVEDLISIYKRSGTVDSKTLQLYQNINNVAVGDLGMRSSDALSRYSLLQSAIGEDALTYDPLISGLDKEGKSKYVSDFYDTLQRRKRDGSSVSLRADYKIALNYLGDDVERSIQAEGTITSKENLLNLFERNKLWDVLKENQLEQKRQAIVGFYNRYDAIESSYEDQLGRDYRRRSPVSALKAEADLQEFASRNAIVKLFLSDRDRRMFSLLPEGDNDSLAKSQRAEIGRQIKRYESRVLQSLDRGLASDVGENYLEAMESIRDSVLSHSRFTKNADQLGRLDSIREAIEKTHYLTLPSLKREGEVDGRAIISLSSDSAPTTGVRLGLDVLQRMSLTFPDYTSDILLNQKRMEELRLQARPVLERLSQEGRAEVNADQLSILKELRETMQRSILDIQELSTVDTVRQMLGDRVQARGATFVPTSSFLLNKDEVGIGSRLKADPSGGSTIESLIRSEYNTIKIVTAGDRQKSTKALADVLNKFSRESKFTVESLESLMYSKKGSRFLSTEQFTRRVVKQLTPYEASKEGYRAALADLDNKFFLSTVLVNRGGAPAMVATSTAGTPIGVISMQELAKRAEAESSFIKVDPKMGSTAMMISAVGHQFSELGDYDGDMFQVVMTDIARITSDITKSNQEIALIQHRLSDRLSSDQETAFLLEERRQALDKVDRLHQYLREKLTVQDEIQKQAKAAGRAGVRQMVSAYTGMPSELFGDSGVISDLRSMTLIQQYRDTQSGMFDNAPHVAAGNEVIEAMSKASHLRIANGNIEGIDLDASGASQQAKDLLKTFVRQAIASGRLTDGETNAQKIAKEFSTVQGSISNLQASLTNLNKGLENMQGQVMSANVFENVQGAVGFAGSSLLGKTYNTIIPLMYSVSQEIAIQRALSSEGPAGAFKQQMLQNLQSIGASEGAIEAVRSMSTSNSQDAIQQVDRVIGFMGTMQQMMRDSLKPKGDGGIGDQMAQFDLEGKLSRAIDDQQRVGVMREFVLSQIGSSIDLPSTDSNKFRAADRERYLQATSFGLMYTLSEYVNAESIDALMGYTKGSSKPSVFASDLRTSYERYKQEYADGSNTGQLMSKEDFTASLMTKLIARAQANFVAFNVMADAPDAMGLVQSIDRFYAGKIVDLNKRFAESSGEQERASISKELKLATQYRMALAPESEGEHVENRLSRFVYTNLTEGGAGIGAAHVKYMRAFGRVVRDLMLDKDLGSAIVKNLEMGIVAVNSMVQRGKAEPETIAGMMTAIEDEISKRNAASSMPELDGLSDRERVSILQQQAYMQALDPSSMFPGLEQLPADERSRAMNEIVRAMTMKFQDGGEIGQSPSAEGTTELSNGMETNLLNKFLKKQISVYEKALGLSSKFQALKQEERLAVQQGDIDRADRISRQADVVEQQMQVTRSNTFSPNQIEEVGLSSSVSEASSRVREQAQIASVSMRKSSEHERVYIEQESQRTSDLIRRHEADSQEAYGRVRHRNELAEIAGLIAGPLIFGASQGAIKLDERAALFGLDVIQSMSSLSQYEDSVVSTKLVGTKAGENYHSNITRQAREAALAFRYQRIVSSMRSSDSTIAGAIQGTAMESMYQLLNMGVAKVGSTIERAGGNVAKSAMGKGAIAMATEVLGGVAALSISRTVMGRGATPREVEASNEIEKILRHYSIEAYQSAERAFIEKVREGSIEAEDSATGEQIATDLDSDGAPTEFETSIEMGLIAFDSDDDGHTIEIQREGLSSAQDYTPAYSSFEG